jgi:hypothetical protein
MIQYRLFSTRLLDFPVRWYIIKGSELNMYQKTMQVEFLEVVFGEFTLGVEAALLGEFIVTILEKLFGKHDDIHCILVARQINKTTSLCILCKLKECMQEVRIGTQLAVPKGDVLGVQ